MGWSDQPLAETTEQNSEGNADTLSTSRMYQQPLAQDGSEAPATWGDTLADVGKSSAAHLAKGTAALLGTPGTIGDLIDTGLTKAGKAIGIIPESWKSPGDSMLSGNSLIKSLSSLTGGATDYEAKTEPGKWAGRIAEFAPSAMVGPGSVAKKLVFDAAIPAVTSGLAGDYIEKSNKPELKPYAELAGAILGGGLSNFIESSGKKILSPGGGADPVRLAEAQAMRDAGYPVTAGQATGSDLVKGIEANNPALQLLTGKTANSEQIRAFTRGSLESSGLNDAVINDLRNSGYVGNPYVANPEVLRALDTANGAKFDAALNGITSQGDNVLLQELGDATRHMNPTGIVKPSKLPEPLQKAISEASNSVRNGVPIDAARLQNLRSELGPYLNSHKVSEKLAAASARDALDNAISRAMSAAGQPEKEALLAQARKEYSNLLAITDAVTPHGIGLEGLIEPERLAGVVRSMNPKAYTRGTNDLGDYSRNAAKFGESLPSPVARRTGFGLAETVIGPAIAQMNVAQIAAFLGISAPFIKTAAVAAGLGAGIDGIRKMAMGVIEKNANKDSFQKYLMNQNFNAATVQSPMSSMAHAAGTAQASGSGIQPAPYKRGGKVGASHDIAADQLVRAAERAKKGWSATTEPLLNQSDDAVAHALEVANRSI